MKIEIQFDKIVHFLCGLIIALIVSFFYNPYIGIGIAVAAGVAKKVYDWFDYGRFDKMDLVATVIGGVTGSLLYAAKSMS